MLGAQSPTRDLGRPDAALEELRFGSLPSHPSPITLLSAPPPVRQSIPVLGCSLTAGSRRWAALGRRGQRPTRPSGGGSEGSSVLGQKRRLGKPPNHGSLETEATHPRRGPKAVLPSWPCFGDLESSQGASSLGVPHRCSQPQDSLLLEKRPEESMYVGLHDPTGHL